MSKETLEGWLRRRNPPIPRPFLPFLLREGSVPVDSLSLATRGGDFLEMAIGRPGRNREAAFHLLSSDAFITYACESVARCPEPRAEMERLLQVLGDRFR